MDRYSLQRGFVPLIFLLLLGGVVGGGTTAVVASKSALPGEPLYVVKTLTETITISLTPNEKRVQVYLEIANEKLREAQKLEEKGATPENIAKAFELYTKYHRQTGQALIDNPNSEESREVTEKLKETTDIQNKILAKVSTKLSQSSSEVIRKAVEETNKSVENNNNPSSNNSNTYQTPPIAVNSNTPSPAVSSTPVAQKTSIPTATTVPTPTPTPTLVPTSQPVTTGSIKVLAVIHAGYSDSNVYKGKVTVKNNSGVILAIGQTDPNGYYTANNLPSGQNLDVILLQPDDYATQYCGDKWSVNLSSGGFATQTMRLRSLGSTPCERQ